MCTQAKAEVVITMYRPRPYKHTVTEATDFAGARVVCLGTYATLGVAIRAAKAADAVCPDETRTILYFNWSRRNRYAHGPVSTWTDDNL